MTEEILRLAALLGGTEEREAEGLRALCLQAEGELRGRLRHGVTAEDCADAFTLSCAWLALADLCVSRCAEREERFSAGGLTVHTGSGSAAEQSATLRRRAEGLMAPYLKGEGFCFAGVPG